MYIFLGNFLRLCFLTLFRRNYELDVKMPEVPTLVWLVTATYMHFTWTVVIFLPYFSPLHVQHISMTDLFFLQRFHRQNVCQEL